MLDESAGFAPLILMPLRASWLPGAIMKVDILVFDVLTPDMYHLSRLKLNTSELSSTAFRHHLKY